LKIPLPMNLICNWDPTQYTKNLQIQNGSESNFNVQVSRNDNVKENYSVYAQGSIALDTYSLCIDVKDSDASLEVGFLILPPNPTISTPSVALVPVSFNGKGTAVVMVLCNRDSKVIEARYNGFVNNSSIADVLRQCSSTSKSPQSIGRFSPSLSELTTPVKGPAPLSLSTLTMATPSTRRASFESVAEVTLSECSNKLAIMETINNTSVLFPFVKCLSRNATVSIING